MDSARIGEMLALATALCWTLSALSFEAASRRVGSLVVNFTRLVMAIVMLAGYGLVVRGRAWPTDATGHTWTWMILSGVVGFYLGDMALFRAFVLIGARLSTLLMSLAPPVAAVIGYLTLGEQIAPLGWLGMGVTLGGIAWVVTERQRVAGVTGKIANASDNAPAPVPLRSPNEPGGPPPAPHVSRWGLTLAVIAAVCQGAGLVLGKMGVELPGGGTYDAFAATQIRAMAGAACFAAMLVVVGMTRQTVRSLSDGRATLATFSGAVFGPFLGVSFLLAAAQRIPSGIAQTLASLIPVFILPFAIFLMKEHVSWRAAAGAGVAVAGVALLMLT